ncbi:hypothetical protein AVEN_153089-1 [Araneus ventricosus]|uniref:Uncharacterized protein n=1 Tax=Araneus ventricosus TaxID=182803 RepID=A0A4Y2E5C4_ARAVE|nr:hypothetical protein AVEN_153089-1 [Araneus ventricosus]
MYAYKMQIAQKLQPNDGPQRVAFAVEIVYRIENEHDFLNRIIFSDEATFCVRNKVNKHNCRIWGSENPHVLQGVERNSSNINVWCALSHDTVIGPFFFAETSVMANIYLEKLQIYAIPNTAFTTHCYLPTRWDPSSLGHGCSSIFGYKFP